MSTYGWILFLSLLIPLIFFFYPKFGFYKEFFRVLITGLVVAGPFLVWDMVATKRGDWGFSEGMVGTKRIGGLPVEEVLFFLVIPFCCLFIWLLIEKYLKERRFRLPKMTGWVAGIAGIIMLIIFWGRGYTTTLIIWSMITVVIMRRLDGRIWQSQNYWRWIAITMVPFSIVNGVLTYLPVVWYSTRAITGIRVVSIPIEDFFYSWSLLSLNLVVYKKISRL